LTSGIVVQGAGSCSPHCSTRKHWTLSSAEAGAIEGGHVEGPRTHNVS